MGASVSSWSSLLASGGGAYFGVAFGLVAIIGSICAYRFAAPGNRKRMASEASPPPKRVSRKINARSPLTRSTGKERKSEGVGARGFQVENPLSPHHKAMHSIRV